jgi:hypothetical protein
VTLAVRVALNEALYLQREPPAREPPGGLEVFLDTGVRLWGIPRLLAASVGLALMANSGRQQGVRVWRGRGARRPEGWKREAPGRRQPRAASPPHSHSIV